MNPHDHYVFVDFENLPNVDVSPAVDLDMHVTLLVGKNQKKVGVDLLRVSQSMGKRLEIVGVGATGPNALDLTLAYYVGRAAARAPNANFAIISKDKDFDPLVSHLRSQGLRVSRHASLATVVATAKPARTAPVSTAVPAAVANKPTLAKRKPASVTRKLVEDWAKAPNARPSSLTKLKALIKNRLGNEATDSAIQSVVDRLRVGGHLTIGNDGKITYP